MVCGPLKPCHSLLAPVPSPIYPSIIGTIACIRMLQMYHHLCLNFSLPAQLGNSLLVGCKSFVHNLYEWWTTFLEQCVQCLVEFRVLLYINEICLYQIKREKGKRISCSLKKDFSLLLIFRLNHGQQCYIFSFHTFLHVCIERVHLNRFLYEPKSRGSFENWLIQSIFTQSRGLLFCLAWCFFKYTCYLSQDPLEVNEESIRHFPCDASPLHYSPPSATSVSTIIGDLGSHSQLRRSRSSVLRKCQTSDDELDELDSPLTSILIDSIRVSPTSTADWRAKESNGLKAFRYQLLREVWRD